MRLGIIVMTAALSWVAPAPSTTIHGADSITQGGIKYGPEIQLSGVYFTNFENSIFTECRIGADCARWENSEHEFLDCAPAACTDLESRILKLNGSHDLWSTFRIVFIGRRSTHRSAKKFLGDTESKVLLDRILQFDLIETH